MTSSLTNHTRHALQPQQDKLPMKGSVHHFLHWNHHQSHDRKSFLFFSHFLMEEIFKRGDNMRILKESNTHTECQKTTSV